MTDLVKIGNTNVVSKKLGLGTNKVGGHNIFTGLKDKDGYAVVKEAIESGITTLDTAYMYGLGRSEEIIGDVIQDYDRSKLIIATKAAQDSSRNKVDNSPEFLRKSVDEALKRLKTDYIDIFYIHFPDEKTPKDQAVRALNELKKSGKIRAIGVSNFSLAQIKEANKEGFVDIVEDNYSLLHRDAEKELFPYLKENKISFVPYFPLASGLLTGKYRFSDSDKFSQYSREKFGDIITSLEIVEKIADRYEATVAQVILAWYMKNPNISIVIPGARKPEQVDQNVKSLDIKLSDKDYRTIDEAFMDVE
ncbi:aldo/keto reductase [Companilactobacillus kimchii]|uniref:NADP-dependent oxidoreductase domain-containing protein n=2 Tax=Companilactobacillus kimchii TaxID=2801452 RepID=A0ABR5NUR3_9LACO|nr:aldo/keto reductase [Companilactobacillus kimchii]KAE9557410.1 oxidoreductase [Companilactobacillus kimchii]KRK52520.1 NADP-dependent oxidoreductase domain-containing protein [Companilactobacillus kimchii DSM 13961 = JCM 10707]OWF32638.1 Protein IolS [Companilactobacillus kimchii]GEO47439.1 oxidoreductase [Companilactobacillus paralimentarius]